MSEKQDLCPICTEPFKFKEIVIDIERWEHETLKAHLDCALYMSMTEEGRTHPPLGG
jgi:hypothetical protein